MEQDSFSIQITRSRLEKGLLAIPKRFTHLFPDTQAEIQVAFNDGDRFELKTFLPDDKKSKESRIFGLGQWFAHHNVQAGDQLTVWVLNRDGLLYRIGLDRELQAQKVKKAHDAIVDATSDEVAQIHLDMLAQITKGKTRLAAKDALLKIAKQSTYQNRARAKSSPIDLNQTVAPGIRVLLAALHKGKCQICSFTFKKRNGEPYFEVHHLDPNIGDHPANLLVLCSNCHAQFEHANVTGLERVGGWLIAVRINGKRHRIRQPLRELPLDQIESILQFLLAIWLSQVQM